MNVQRITASVATALALSLHAAAGSDASIHHANQLRAQGAIAEAFEEYARIPGALYLAAELLREEPETCRPVLATLSDVQPGALALLQAEDAIARGAPAAALGLLHQAGVIWQEHSRGFETNLLCFTYPVDIPRGEPLYGNSIAPFQAGPGSHKDNWLVRRYITLGAGPAARVELARIWQAHCITATQSPEACGFDGLGLSFAIDYAFFLSSKADDPAAAQAVLTAAMLAIDMDRNPNLATHISPVPPVGQPAPQLRQQAAPPRLVAPVANAIRIPRRYGFGSAAGLTRTEFIRIAYGAARDAGWADALTQAMDEAIARGENRLRRVLAQVRLHQGRKDDALALDLAYLDTAAFVPFVDLYRRGVLFQDAGEHERAATALEVFLKLECPASVTGLPDEPEASQRRAQMCSIPMQMNPAWYQTPAKVREDALQRLEAVYQSLGRSKDGAALALARAATDPRRLASLDQLNRLAEAQAREGRADEFATWIEAMARQHTSGEVSVALNLYLKRYEAAADSAAAIYAAQPNRYQLEAWVKQFEAGGEAVALHLLRKLAAGSRSDGHYAWLLLLDRDPTLPRDEQILAFESIMATNAVMDVFRQGKGYYNRTSFRNVYEVAYRLLRLYEQTARREELVSLGMRVLRGDPPFGRSGPLQTVRPNWNSRQIEEDVLDCVFVTLPHIASDAERAALRAAAWRHPCVSLRRQVSRCLGEADADAPAPADGAVVVTPVENENLKLLTSRDDVRAMSDDGVWIGTSWGLVGYLGEEVVQLPLGARVQCIVRETESRYLVGTRDGLYRLYAAEDANAIRCERLQLPHDPDRDTREDIACVVLWGRSRAIWAAGSDGIWRLRPPAEAGGNNAASYFGRSGETLFTHGDKLCSDQGIYDPETDSFAPVITEPAWAPLLPAATNFTGIVDLGRTLREAQLAGARPARLIGSAGGILWADVYVDGRRRHRPAIADPRSRVAVPLNEPTAPRAGQDDPLCINNDITIICHTNGVTWFGGDHDSSSAILSYDHAGGALTFVRQHWSTVEHGTGPTVWRYRGGGSGAFGRVSLGSGVWDMIPGLALDGDRGPRFTWRQRLDGTLLLGASLVREWWEDNLGFDNNQGMSHHILDLEGGLFEIDSRTLTWRRADPRHTRLADFYINNLRLDAERKLLYVCTNGGVTVLALGDGFPVVRHITVSDGLPANKVDDVACIGNRLFFACALGDNRGGLAVQDVTTKLIQTYHTSDGLECEKIRRLRVEGDNLHILYGTVHMRGRDTIPNRGECVGAEKRIVSFPSTVLDTRSGRFAEGHDVLPPPAPPDRTEVLPILGGEETCRVQWDNWTFVGGTHGLVASRDGAAQRVAAYPRVGFTSTARQGSWDAARAMGIAISSPDELANRLTSPNGAVRAEALAKSWHDGERASLEPYVPLYAGALRDDHVRVRSTALFMLTRARRAGAPGTLPALRQALNDPDAYIRASATIELCQAGEPPAGRHLMDCVLRDSSFDNLPFGATSCVGVTASRHFLIDALAPNVQTPEQLAVFFAFPFTVDTYEPRAAAVKALGARLREHPEWLPHLLALEQEKDWWASAVQLAQHVMGFAGPELLPALHAALASDNRVIRSNAARGCGAIGDAQSIAPVMRALERESGLSRASCVWALGELKATNAVPRLCELFAEAKADALAGERGHFLGQQMAAVHQAQFESLTNIGAVENDYLALGDAASPSKEALEEREELLKPEHILAALDKIGPALAQPFYRDLAGDTSIQWRLKATECLGAAGGDERTPGVATLRSLLADERRDVRLTAAVSLLFLDEELGAPPLQKALSASAPETDVINVLQRLPGRHLVRFLNALKAWRQATADSYQKQHLDILITRAMDCDLKM